MKFTFFKSSLKKESGLHALFTSMTGAGRGGVHLIGSTIRHASSAGGQPEQVKQVSGPDRRIAVRRAFNIVGCHIENNEAGFDDQEIAGITRRIEAACSVDINWIIGNIPSYDKTVITDLFIDNFGIVVANNFVYPAETEDAAFWKQANDRILKWVFPLVFHQGRCRIAISEKGRT